MPYLLSKHLEPDQALGQTLRSLRNKRKWSQTDLALRAEVDRNYISLIELGRNSPSVRMLFRLCDALDLMPSDMLKDVERRIGLIQQPAVTENSTKIPIATTEVGEEKIGHRPRFS